MKNLNLCLIVHGLNELSEIAIQRKRWLKGDGLEISSLVEAIETLFTDSGLGAELEKGSTIFTEQIDTKFADISSLLAAIKTKRPPQEIIYDPKMFGIRKLAREILFELQGGGFIDAFDARDK